MSVSKDKSEEIGIQIESVITSSTCLKNPKDILFKLTLAYGGEGSLI